MEGDRDLLPIWEAVVKVKVRTEGLSTLNKTLARGILYYLQFFGERAQFSDSLPFLALVKNIYLWNTSLYLDFTKGGGVQSMAYALGYH